MNIATTCRSVRAASVPLLLVAAFLVGGLADDLRAQNKLDIESGTLSMSANAGSSSTVYEQLRNYGSDSVIAYAFLSGTDASYFSIGSSPVVVPKAPDSTGDTSHTARFGYYNFAVTFNAPASGTYHATLVLTDSINSPYTVPITGTGIDYQLGIDTIDDYFAFVGSTYCLTPLVYNTASSGTMTITSLSIAGGSSSPFSFTSPSLPLAIAAREIDSIQVCYSPTSAGSDVDTLRITYTNTAGTTVHTLIVLRGSSRVNTNACVHIEGDSSAFRLSAGQSATRQFKLANDNSAAITIWSVSQSGATDHFSITSPTFPITLGANQDTDMTIRFQAGNSFGFASYSTDFTFEVTTSTDSCSNSLSFTGYSDGPRGDIDSAQVDLLPDSSQTLEITLPGGGTAWELVRVDNNSGSRAKIDQIFMSVGTYFAASLLSPADSTLPFYVANSNSFWVGVQLLDTMLSTYTDTLVIVSEAGLTSSRYAIHAVRGSQGVELHVTLMPASISISPNPSHGFATVSLSGMKNADIEVLDLLGRVVAAGRATNGQWMWNGLLASGGTANGSYIVHATGTTTGGEQASTSRRLVLTR